MADRNDYLLNEFSANNFYEDKARKELENKFASKLEVTELFNRQAVSYQLNKKETIHGWLKYREGFSSFLVNYFLKMMKLGESDYVLDPFLGSGTTSLVCEMNGVGSIGYDIMPISAVSIEAKTNIGEYSIEEIKSLIETIEKLSIPSSYKKTLKTITITDGAYSNETSRFIAFVTEYVEKSDYSRKTKNLFKLCVLNCLESVSYTIKGGQYLGWDYRSPKIIEANKQRIASGKAPFPKKIVRSVIQEPRDAIVQELNKVLLDIEYIKSIGTSDSSKTIFKQTSSLFELPILESNSISGVITSPPYCNRYDYTRTYALELVYLGLGDEEVKKMRQDLLSCTVESRSKEEALKSFYSKIGREKDYNAVIHLMNKCPALQETLNALEARKDHGDLNNNGVIKMVRGYFYELAFIYSEIKRICKKGSLVVFVNDNVRYGGEVIPVDFISCEIAEKLGFKIKKVLTIEQQKGNSSQQMAKFGKVALRKSITVWEA